MRVTMALDLARNLYEIWVYSETYEKVFRPHASGGYWEPRVEGFVPEPSLTLPANVFAAIAEAHAKTGSAESTVSQR